MLDSVVYSCSIFVMHNFSKRIRIPYRRHRLEWHRSHHWPYPRPAVLVELVLWKHRFFLSLSVNVDAPMGRYSEYICAYLSPSTTPVTNPLPSPTSIAPTPVNATPPPPVEAASRTSTPALILAMRTSRSSFNSRLV